MSASVEQQIDGADVASGAGTSGELVGHTLLLVQFVENEESRTYLDTKSPWEALETLCRLYENYCL